MHRIAAFALVTVGLVSFAASAPAQTYPDRLIKIPQTAGGPTDLLARTIAQRLQAAFGTSVIAENRGGAGGAIAAKAVAVAEPDGYTLLMGNTSTLVHIPILSRSAGYDPAKAFAPVARLAVSHQVFFVHQVSLLSLTNLLPLAKVGKIRVLAATSPQRFPELPDVPTIIESGFPDFTVPAFFGVVAPAGTPPAIVERLNVVINRELRTPEMQRTIANMGAERGTGSAAEFSAFIAAERDKWSAVAASAGIKID
jgi:tripartite-type tricarboxylate transporter receptor subunit TctC